MEIWLVNTTNFTARIIHLGMKLYCARIHEDVPPVIYNHGLMYDPIEDVIYEADFPKVVKIKRVDWEKKKKNKTAVIKKIALNLTKRQEYIMLMYLKAQIGKAYETINFWWHLVKIITLKWNGDRTDAKHYCYELVIRALNSVLSKQLDEYMNPYEFDVFASSNLFIFKRNKL